MRPGPSRLKVFTGAVIAMVTVVVVTGLYVAGSPGTQRQLRFDSQRTGDLHSLASAVDSHYARTGVLPASLDELAVRRDVFVPSLADPVTDELYGYSTTGDTTYELCATFDFPSDDQTEEHMRAPAPVKIAPILDPYLRTWSHAAGRQCFQLNARDALPRQACGLHNPCASGNTCAALPGEEGPICVPSGKECIVAGCPEGCVMLESYPVQVRCTSDSPIPPPAAANDCVLMRKSRTGAVDCFGCADGICKDPASGWEPYGPGEGYIGVPYACFAAGRGCELAQ